MCSNPHRSRAMVLDGNHSGLSLEEDEDGLFIAITQTTAASAIAKTTTVSKNLISAA